MNNVRSHVLMLLILLYSFSSVFVVSATDTLYGSWVEHYGTLPDFMLQNTEGHPTSSKSYTDGITIVTFIMEECDACRVFLNELEAVSDQGPAIIAVSPTMSDTTVSAIRSILPETVLLSDPNYSVAKLFDVREAPSAYIFSDGMYYGQVRWNWSGERIKAYVEAIISGTLEPPRPRNSLVAIGDKVPLILAYEEAGTLQVIRGFDKPTLLIFASATCSHCLTEIEELSSAYPFSSFELLIVGHESYHTTQELSVQWPISAVYDAYGTTFHRFGIWATPTHVLVCGTDVVDVWPGRSSRDTLERRVSESLSFKTMCSAGESDAGGALQD